MMCSHIWAPMIVLTHYLTKRYEFRTEIPRICIRLIFFPCQFWQNASIFPNKILWSYWKRFEEKSSNFVKFPAFPDGKPFLSATNFHGNPKIFFCLCRKWVKQPLVLYKNVETRYPDENIYELCGKNECMQPLYHIHIEYI